jgi:glycine amidinotransferase
MVADPSDRWGQSLSSVYLGMNVPSIDERRVVVEEQQKPLMAKLREWGFEPVPCPFTRYSNFGGGFHCATADVRRRGTLRSYA